MDSPRQVPAWTTFCPNCGQRMLLTKSVPVGDVPSDLCTYECRSCGVTYTEAAKPDPRIGRS